MKHNAFIALIAAVTLSSHMVLAQEGQAVDQRQENQEQRIDQGIESGELTKKEAHRLEHRQRRLNRMENKAKADGEVTPQEARKLRKAQNHASREIFKAKHNKRDRK